MCIIVVKPEETSLPSKETLKICFENNKDGAGYMYRRDGTIHIIKGFFDFEALWNSLKSVENYDVCIHFRWATHGEVVRGNCHPFPVTTSVRELQHTRSQCVMGIAHNGVIGGMKASKRISDTMMFIKNLDSSKKLATQLASAKGNKFCVMTATQTLLIGDFIYEKDNGCYFSNDGYKELDIMVYYKQSDNTLYQACWHCPKQTCEGCDIYDKYFDEEDKCHDNYDLLSDKEFFEDCELGESLRGVEYR